MTGPAEAPRPEGAFALLRRLVDGVIGLSRLEVTHARQEIGQMLADTGRGLLLIGIALIALLAALITLVVVLILALAAITGLDGWLMGIIVLIALVLLAIGLGYRGFRRVRIGPPEETIASVKEEIAWAKRLLKRD